MKTAIYVEDGVTQLVLTPESDFEVDILEKINDEKLSAQILNGSFAECMGGWIRQTNYKNSLIVRVNKK